MSRLGKTGRRALASAVATFMMLAVAVAVPTSAGAVGHEDSNEAASVTGGGKGLFKSSYRVVTEDGRKVRVTAIPVQFDYENNQLYADVLVRGVATGNDVAPERESVLVEHVPVYVNTAEGMGAGGPGMAGMSSHGCDILNLELGAINVDLLGLVIDLSQVNLDIVAEPGAGNLLGNLLCAVAGLLDPASPLEELLGQVNTLLDQLLGGLLGSLNL